MKSDDRVVLPLIHVPEIPHALKVTIFGFMCSIQTLWGLQHLLISIDEERSIIVPDAAAVLIQIVIIVAEYDIKYLFTNSL